MSSLIQCFATIAKGLREKTKQKYFKVPPPPQVFQMPKNGNEIEYIIHPSPSFTDCVQLYKVVLHMFLDKILKPDPMK